MDINTDCSCSRARDTDLASGSNPNPENIMALGGNTNYSDLHQSKGEAQPLDTNLALRNDPGT